VKHVLSVLALQLIAIGAMAGTEQVYSTQLETTNNACADVTSIRVTNKEASLDGDHLVLELANGSRQTAKFTYASTTCLSDMVCITSNNFDGEVSASLERNNDGQYPTQDLPGYRSLSLLYLKGDGAITCSYLIQAQ
jgi:hypothetical protein